MQQKLQQPHVHSNSPRGRALRRWYAPRRQDGATRDLTMHELALLTRAHPHYPLIAGQGRAGA